MRSIEEMQASIKDIQSELQLLREDLDDLRSEKNGGALNFDIDEVAVKAKHDPVSPHPLSAKDEYTRRRYLILLLSVAQFEQDKLRESLLLAHRIAYGCGYLTDGNLLDEYTSSHSLTFAQLDELVALFANDDLRLMMIEEMLLMAGQFDKVLKPAVDYISQVCQLLNITNEEITYLSQMAAVILTGDLSLYTCGIKNNYLIFDCYLREFDFEKYRKKIFPNIPERISLKYPPDSPFINNTEIPLESAGLRKSGNTITICSKYSIKTNIHEMINDINIFLYGKFDENSEKIKHLKELKKSLEDTFSYIGGVERSVIDNNLLGHCLYHLMIENNLNPWKIALFYQKIGGGSYRNRDKFRETISQHYADDSKYVNSIIKFMSYINYILVRNYERNKNLNHFDRFTNEIQEFEAVKGYNDELDFQSETIGKIIDDSSEIAKHITTYKETEGYTVLFVNHLEKNQREMPVGVTVHPLDSIDAEDYFETNGGIIQMIENVKDDFELSHDINFEIIKGN